MTEATETTHDAPARQQVKIKNKTVLIVLLLVIIPWVALALPGYFAGKYEQDKDRIKAFSIHKKFGWPLAHKTESKVVLEGVMRGGQFRASATLPYEKMNALVEEHVGLFNDSGDNGILNLVPRQYEEHTFASLWTDKNSYPVEIRNYIQDTVIKEGTSQTWSIPMLVANVVLLILTCLGVGYLVEKSSK